MAAAVVQAKTGAQNTGLATVAATWNTAATAGNVIVIIVGADDYAATPPSGWTLSTGCKQETFLGHYLWWKVAAGGETSVNYTIGSAAPSAWITMEISGLTASPYDISAGTLDQSAATSMTSPTLTPSSGDRYILASIGASLSAAAFTGMSGWTNSFTERGDSFTTLASGTRDGISAADFAVTANGSTGYSTTATFDGSVTPQSRTGIIIAFKVAGGGGTDTPIAIAQGTPTLTGRSLTSMGFAISMPDEP